MRALRADPRVDCAVTYTTRAPRDGEQEGVDYRFVSREAFLELRAAGAFAEVEVGSRAGDLYGSPRTFLEAGDFARPRIIVLGVPGAMAIRSSGARALFVFIAPPSLEALRQRLVERDRAARGAHWGRLDAAAAVDRFDIVINNRDSDSTLALLRGLLGLGTAASEPLKGTACETC